MRLGIPIAALLLEPIIYLSLLLEHLEHYQMKDVGLYTHLPIKDSDSLVELDIEQPKHPTGHNLLVTMMQFQ